MPLASGISFIGPAPAAAGHHRLHAFKSVRPNDEPSTLVDLLYYNFYLMAIGVQMAGPTSRRTRSTGHVRLPRRHRPGRVLEVRPRPLHPDAGRPGDLLGPQRRLAAQQARRAPTSRPMPGSAFRPGEWPAHRPGRSRTVTVRSGCSPAIGAVAPGVLDRRRPPGRVAAGRRAAARRRRRSASSSRASCSARSPACWPSASSSSTAPPDRQLRLRRAGLPWPACSASQLYLVAAGTTSWPWAWRWPSWACVLGGIVESW